MERVLHAKSMDNLPRVMLNPSLHYEVLPELPRYRRGQAAQRVAS